MCMTYSFIHLYILQLFMHCLSSIICFFCFFSVLIICFVVGSFVTHDFIVVLFFCYYLCILLASVCYSTFVFVTHFLNYSHCFHMASYSLWSKNSEHEYCAN